MWGAQYKHTLWLTDVHCFHKFGKGLIWLRTNWRCHICVCDRGAPASGCQNTASSVLVNQQHTFAYFRQRVSFCIFILAHIMQRCRQNVNGAPDRCRCNNLSKSLHLYCEVNFRYTYILFYSLPLWPAAVQPAPADKNLSRMQNSHRRRPQVAELFTGSPSAWSPHNTQHETFCTAAQACIFKI